MNYTFLADTCIRGFTGTRRDNDMARRQSFYLFYGKFVVPNYPDIGIDASDKLIEIVGKAVLLINQKYH